MLNGGVADLAAARAASRHVDGVMMGRAAYQTPELLLDVDPALFGEHGAGRRRFCGDRGLYAYDRARARRAARGCMTYAPSSWPVRRPPRRARLSACPGDEGARAGAGLEVLREARWRGVAP